MSEKKSSVINKIILWTSVFLVGLTPIFFLPFTSEFYGFNKNVLLISLTFILFILWAVKMVFNKRVDIKKTIFDLPILALAGAFIVSTIFAAPNKWETLWLPNGTGTIITLTLLYFIIVNNISKDNRIKLLSSFVISSVILSLVTIYQFIGLGENLISETSYFAFMRVKSWTPAGNYLSLITLLIPALVLISTRFIFTLKEIKENKASLAYYSVSILAIITSLVISLRNVFFVTKPILLPISTSWAIMIEVFKNIKNFFLGVGSNSFLDAFSQFRPVNYNLTNFWNIRFGVSGNFYLHILTTLGILGFAALVWLIIKVVKTRKYSPYMIALSSIFLIFFVLPINLLIIFTMYLLLSLIAIDFPKPQYREESKILPVIILALVAVISGTVFYFTSRVYMAEFKFRNSLINIALNDGVNAYNNQLRAIGLNPFNDVYRVYYSQTNLSLADNIASRTDISDEDRQTITNLIQQSIREAKMAVSLNQNKVVNWENLTQIYHQLVNFAEGAEQWTLSTYQQTILLDPVNPQLKLGLGGLYYALGQYDNAILIFQKAIENKPNFANGYYNLSAAYREKEDYQKAFEYMQITLSLIPVGTEDYQKANLELEQLAKNLPTAQATESGQSKDEITPPQLLEPEPLPEPVITPPIELPEESAPEVSIPEEATNTSETSTGSSQTE